MRGPVLSKCVKEVNRAARSPKAGAANPGPFGLISAIKHWLSGIYTRQYTDKTLSEAQLLIKLATFVSSSRQTGFEGRIIVGTRGGKGRTRAEARALL